MNLNRARINMVTVLLLGTSLAWSQANASNARSQTKDRARTVISQTLPLLEGDHLRAVLLEIRYGPGEASMPHTHPCAVVGYVVEGSLRTQVQGQPETIYKVGQSFYEAPNSVHLVSRNSSTTESAKFLAFFVCDRDTPLSVDVPEHSGSEGASR